jgi:hypothetical protein
VGAAQIDALTCAFRSRVKCAFLRNGGDLRSPSRQLLGHSSYAMVRRYAELASDVAHEKHRLAFASRPRPLLMNKSIERLNLRASAVPSKSRSRRPAHKNRPADFHRRVQGCLRAQQRMALSSRRPQMWEIRRLNPEPHVATTRERPSRGAPAWGRGDLP